MLAKIGYNSPVIDIEIEYLSPELMINVLSSLTDNQVTFNGVGDRQMDHIIHINQNGRFVPIMHYNAVAETAEITYAHFKDGTWQRLIWTGGTTEVMCLKSRLSNKCKHISNYSCYL